VVGGGLIIKAQRMHGMRREYDDDEDDGRRVGAFQQQNGDE
jgi:hypothetical protein